MRREPRAVLDIPTGDRHRDRCAIVAIADWHRGGRLRGAGVRHAGRHAHDRAAGQPAAGRGCQHRFAGDRRAAGQPGRDTG
ncbi:MAG TPA: hypothetical protein VFW96_06460 [Thermomicrobiales bacterium]|nr:hypothetical protein [Thermomicrobiales bacterium]